MKWLAFDIETTGSLPEYALQPWRVPQGLSRIRTWAVAEAGERLKAVLAPHDREALSEQLTREVSRWVEGGYVVCAWNATFEIAWLCMYVDPALVGRVRWLDGMLLWRHLRNTPDYSDNKKGRLSYSLKDAVRQYLPQFADYEKDIDFFGPDVINLMYYNALDTRFTLLLTKAFYDVLAKEPKRLRAAKIEAASLFHVGLANVSGIPIDREALEQLDAKLEAEAREALEQLEQHGATADILASPAKLSDVLFGLWGLKPLKKTKTGASTDKEVLTKLAQKDPRVALIRAYREAVGNRTKFVENLLESVRYNGTGRSHPQARIFGTYSGRITISSQQGKNKDCRQIGWAQHQMKRDPVFRGVVVAPEGYNLVEFDAAGQEFRWMAILSGDPTMLKLCLPGEDPHAYMGAQIDGHTYEEVRYGAKHGDKKLKAVRQMGKVANLSLQYRTSAKKLQVVAKVQHGIEMPLPLAERIKEVYLASYRFVPQYWARQIATIKSRHWVETLAGRRVYISNEQVMQYTWSVESTSINFPVQGTGADQKYLALLAATPVLNQYGAQFLFDLHDGLYFIVPKEHTDRFIEDMHSTLCNLPYEKAWGFVPPIPLPFDCKVGTTWGNLTEVDI
jgi:DNA polymerase I-like protein with 3'-5' exonuclease and polymerase domains